MSEKLPPLPDLDKPQEAPLWGFWEGAFPVAAERAELVKGELCAPIEPVVFVRMDLDPPKAEIKKDDDGQA